MKWDLHNEVIDKIPKKKLNKEIKKSGLTKFILDSIINTKNNNDTTTFLTNNQVFLEKTIKKIVSLCYSKNIKLYSAIDNHEYVYMMDDFEGSDENIFEDHNRQWYFTFSKVAYEADNNSTICYYFNFIKQSKNYHLTLMLDKDMA
jgi:hypothetical protein